MNLKNLQKRATCMILALLMVFTAVPVTRAAQADGLCVHHTAQKECEECRAEAALENVIALFTALPEAGTITATTTETEKDAVFAQLEAAMLAYDALWEEYPEQAAVFEETQLPLIQNAIALNDALTGNTAQTYALQSYNQNSRNNVTITVTDEDGNPITGAQVTVSSGADTYEVFEAGNGQYKFTKKNGNNSHTITISAAGYETKTEETWWFWNNAVSITLEAAEDITQEDLKTFKVFYIATGKLPDSYAGAGDSGDYGPSGNDTPLVLITVDINKLKREYADVAQYKENTSSNYWEFTPVGSAQNMAATQAFWEAVWECMTEESREAFVETGFANDFYGYVLKQQKSGRTQHCDGVLTKTPPVYVTELYENNTYFGGTVTDGEDAAFKTMEDIQQMYESHLGVDIIWTSKTAGTYFSAGRIYTATITQTNLSSAEKIQGSEIPYESKNDSDTYYLAKFDLTTAEGAEGYYAVIYTDGVDSEAIFDNQLTTVQSGTKAPAFSGTPQREGYLFQGWRKEGSSGLLTDADIAAMTVTDNLTFHAVWEPVPTSFTGTVNVQLNDAYATDITDLIGANAKLYVSKTADSYIQLEKTGLGAYSAELENGIWNLYYSDDGVSYTLADTGALVINNASASLELDFYSVRYELDGGTATPELPVSYHIRGNQVKLTATVPVKAGYRFTGWKTGATVYQPEATLTDDITAAYTLVAQWEKTVSVTIHVTIDHQGGGGIDQVATKDDVYLELVSRANHTAAYLETGNSLTLNDTSHAGFTYGSEETAGIVTETWYKSEGVTFADMPGGTVEYSVVTSKTGYDTEVTASQDEEGNWIVHVQMEFNPTNFNLDFSVEVDASVPQAYLPNAAIVKVTFWNGQQWEVITQQAGGEPGVRVNIDANTRKGSGSYPVWKAASGSTIPYGYRIIVTAFVYPNGTIVPASVATADAAWGDGVYLATMKEVSDGQTYGSLKGAYYDAAADAQKGTLSARITMDLYDVTFHAMGGTIDGQATKTVEDQYRIPALSSYKPVRDGGYIFEGWYTKNGTNGDWGSEAISYTDLTGNITLYAKWREPIRITGTVYVAGSYLLDGQTHIIHDEDRAKTVMLLLRKQGSAGVYATATIDITYGTDHVGVGTYAFTGLADDGTVYYIEESAANYDGVYLNEPESLSTPTNFAVYSSSDNTAVLNGDKTAQVNAYLPFNPASFDLKYSVDATAIGSAYRPTKVEILVTYDADHTITAPEAWPVISQMVFGTEYNGNVITLGEGKGNGSTSVWSSFPNGTVLYDYGIRVDTVTGPKLTGYAKAPYTITYQAPAHQTAGGQSKALVATMTPNQYAITYELGADSTAVSGMHNAPKTHTWSYDTDLSAVIPSWSGYEFLGWYDNPSFNGEPVTKVDAAVAEDITLYAKWYQRMDDVDLSVTIIHKIPGGTGEAGNYDKDLQIQLIRAKKGMSIYESVSGQNKSYRKDVWHTLGDDADQETLFVPAIFEGLGHDYAYSLNVSLDGYYVTEKTVTPVVDSLTGATTYQVAVTLQYNPDLLNFNFDVEMAPGVDKSLWPESAEVRVTCWYDHPSVEIGLDWNTITQHESGSVTVVLDSTGKGTGSYPVWQWLDKSLGIPYYYRVEVVSLHLSDGSILLMNGTGSEHDVVYSGSGYSATVETAGCVAPSGTALAGAYGQGTSGVYAQIGEVKAVISIDRWKDTPDAETGGDGVDDHQQALILFRSADEAMGTVSGKTTQVYTLIKSGSAYSAAVTPDAVDTMAKTAAGYVFSHWTNAAGVPVDPFQTQTVKGGQTYVYTAHWKYNENLRYTVQYLDRATGRPVAPENTVANVTYGTTVLASDKVITVDGYVFDHAESASISVGMGENVLRLYYAADQLDDVNDKETGGDGIADYKQVVIRFASGTNGSVSGKTTQVITLTNVDAEGNYVGSVTPEAVTITANAHYTFDKWKLPSHLEKTEENAPYAEANKLAVEGGQTYTYAVFWKARTYSYQVQYLEKGSNAVLSEAVTKYLVYDGTSKTETAISITGYHVVPTGDDVRTLVYAEGQIITFYYEKNTYSLTVHFVDIDTDSRIHSDATVQNLPYMDMPSITVLQNLATIPGYHYVEADPNPVVIKDPSQQNNRPNEITLKYRKNNYDLSVLYYYDGVLDDDETEILPGIPYGTQIADVWSYTAGYDKSGDGYVLDQITGNDVAISDNAALNAVHVYYLSDRLVDHGKTSESDGVGDGIPDIYQVTVTYEVINGTWSDQQDTKLSYVFTLYQKDDVGKWTPVTPVLGTTVPTGEPGSGFSGSGHWMPVKPDSATAVHGNADYVLAYTDANTHAITVTVVNGGVKVDGIPETDTHFIRMVNDKGYSTTDVDKTALIFTPDQDHMLWSVIVDGAEVPNPTLTDGKYYVCDVAHDNDHSIVVVFEKDEFGEDKDNDGNWDEPDGIPDKYQKRINYRIVNGTWDGADKADKHIYVTLMTGSAYDVNGTATLTDPYPSGKQPAAGYVAGSGSWVDEVAHSVSFPKTVSGLQTETFLYSYHEKQKVTITIVVEGGTSLPKPSTTVYEYTDATTTIQFAGNEDHILTSATANGTAITLTDGKYTHDYTEDLRIQVIYKLDRWKDDPNTDSETGGDNTPDEQQALVKFLAGANGNVEGTTTQVYTLDGNGVTLKKVTAKPENGYRLLYWRDTDGNTYTDVELFTAVRMLEGGKQYVYTAIFGKDVFDYTVEYYFDGELDASQTKKVTGVEYQTAVTLNPANRTGAENRYMLEKVEPATLNISHISANNVIKVYYVTDQWNDAEDVQTGGDHIPDYRQAVIQFISGPNGAVSGKTVQVFTLEKNGNHYSGIVVPAEVTATAATGYQFSCWEKTAAEVNPYQPTTLSGGQKIIYTARFEKDSFGYRVEYYYDGVLTRTEDGAKTEFETVVTVNPNLRDGDYMLEKVEPATKSVQIGAVEEANVIRVYYAKDVWKDDPLDSKDSQTGGDEIPDYRQVLVTFVPGDSNGTVTGTGTTQVFTFAEGVASADVTPVLTDVLAKGNTGYAFDYWTKDNLLRRVSPSATLTNVSGGTTIVFKAHFAKDAWKDADKTPVDDADSETGGDNIPDKYQAVVTYFVENGTWHDGTDAQIAEVFTLYSWDPADCRWIKLEVTLGDTVPVGMKPAAGYTTSGYWEQKDTAEDDPTAATQVTQNGTYTYFYGERRKFHIVVTVENGQVTPDQTAIQVVYGEDQTLSFQSDTGYALDSVTVDGTEAVLVDGSYTFADVTADHSIHVVYSKDSWKDSQQTPEADTDSEEGGDGIPDYRQAIVVFAADRNGTMEGTTRYVITLPEVDGVYKGQFCAEETEVFAKANEGYKFAQWVLTKEALVRAMPTDAADPYVPMEVLGGNYYLYTALFTEDMHDVTYPDAEKDNAPADGKPDAQTVQAQVGKFIRVDPNGGKWNGSPQIQDVKIEQANQALYNPMLNPVREGYTFVGWKCTAGPADSNVVYVFTACYEAEHKDVTYPEADSDTHTPENTTVPVQSTKYIQIRPNGGLWNSSAEDQMVQITADHTVADPVRSGYLFMGWVRTAGTEKDVVYIFTAQWEKDEIGKTDADGKDIPDGIPDKYQKKVVFKVENGYWEQGTDADAVLWLTLVDENGNWDENGSAKLEIPAGMYAERGYENGKWDAEPSALVKGTATETFTYCFSQKPIDEHNPNTGDRSAESLRLYMTGMLISVAALILLALFGRKKVKQERS